MSPTAFSETLTFTLKHSVTMATSTSVHDVVITHPSWCGTYARRDVSHWLVCTSLIFPHSPYVASSWLAGPVLSIFKILLMFLSPQTNCLCYGSYIPYCTIFRFSECRIAVFFTLCFNFHTLQVRAMKS